MSRQNTLFAVANHSNLGKGFEKDLAATHDWYRLQRWADVVKNPSEWQFISEREYQEMLTKLSGGALEPGSLAICDNQRKMRRVRSDVDFSGGGKNFSVCFDVKETSADKLPLSMLKPHQIHRIRESAACGTVAGFLVMLSLYDRFFFIPSLFIQNKNENYLRQKIGKRRASKGSASITLSELEANCVEIFRHKTNMLWHWLPRLVTNA